MRIRYYRKIFGIAIIVIIIITSYIYLNKPRVEKEESCILTPIWILPTGMIDNPPIIRDINRDGLPEVIISKNNRIYTLLGINGDIIWKKNTNESYYVSSIILGDVNSDGWLEVIVGSSGGKLYPAIYDEEFLGNISVLDGRDGSLLWSYVTQRCISNLPALGDVDGDGKLEIVFSSIGIDNSAIYALNGEDGSLQWSYVVNNPALSPVLGDVDGDGRLEVVVSSHDGAIYALNGEDGSLQWSYVVGDEIDFPPALGDVDGDSDLEIVFSSYDDVIYALNGEDGSLQWSYVVNNLVSSLALGDVDGDGKLEVVTSSYDGVIYALNGEDGSLQWSYVATGPVSFFSLGDVDGDGKLELVLSVFSMFDNIFSHLTLAFDICSAGFRVYWQGIYGDPFFNSTRCLSFIDPDADFLSSYSESILGTSPRDSDTDGDGLLDGWEVYHGHNPLVFDNMFVLTILLVVLVVPIVSFLIIARKKKIQKALILDYRN